MNTLDTVAHSAGFYPITCLYLAGVGLGLLVTRELLTFGLAVLIFALVAMAALLLAAWKEIRTVHKLVNGQRHELIQRIDELTAVLVKAGVNVPPSGPDEKEAKREDDHNGQ